MKKISVITLSLITFILMLSSQVFATEFDSSSNVLTSDINGFFHEYNSKIVSVTFYDFLPEEVTREDSNIIKWDVSEAGNKTVFAWLMLNEEETQLANCNRYDAFIGAEGGVVANPDSSCLFLNFNALKNINGLEKFDTSKIINMSKMFAGCTSLEELDLVCFDTSSATNMNLMFLGCKNLSIKGLTLPENVNVQYMFKDSYNITLQNWDTNDFNDASYMFADYKGNHLELGTTFNTSNVENMASMFENCNNLEELDVTTFDTTNVTNMNNMFNGCDSLNSLDVSHFNIQNSIKNLYKTFCAKIENLNISTWDFTNDSDNDLQVHLFDENTAPTNIIAKNISLSQNGIKLFTNNKCIKTLDLSNTKFDESVYSLSHMFDGCGKLDTINLDNWDTSSITDMCYMFRLCSALETLNLTHLNVENVENISWMFDSCTSLSELNLSKWNTLKVSDSERFLHNTRIDKLTADNFIFGDNTISIFRGDRNSIDTLSLKNIDLTSIRSLNKMFYSANITTIEGLTTWYTYHITDLSEMFENCSNLTTLDLSYWNTGNVTNMNRMFADSFNLKTIIISNLWSTNAVQTGSDMFTGCYSLVGNKNFSYSPSKTDVRYANINYYMTPIDDSVIAPPLVEEPEKPAEKPSEPSEKPSETPQCSCNCHSSGILKFFFQFINFFEKLFGKNKVCACGVSH